MQPSTRRIVGSFALALFITLASACGGSESEIPSRPSADVEKLTIIENVVGTGTQAVVGNQVTVDYEGSLYNPEGEDFRGTMFDSTAEGEPLSFQLGTTQIISGFNQGVVGMKVGGKRTVIVPSRLAYGRNGLGPIPPNTAVVFDIELLEVE